MFGHLNIRAAIESFINSLDLAFSDFVVLLIAVPIIFGAFFVFVAFKK